MLRSLHQVLPRRFVPLALFCLLSGSGAYAAVCSTGTNYDVTTTCTVPPGMNAMTVQLWGAGASGNLMGAVAGAGGGGGSFCGATVAVTPGATLNLNIGTGGNIAFGAAGNSGGATSLTGAGFSGLTANGGYAPFSTTGGVAGDTGACTAAGAVAFPGGAGGAGGVSWGAGGGGSATPSAGGGTGATSFAGGTGGLGQGNGGAGGIFNGGPGSNGFPPGGGGGGGANSAPASGAGADGRIIILAFNATQTITFTSTAPNPGVAGGTYLVTATGGGSGNPVTFTIDGASTPGACSINASTVSFTGQGTCIVDANQAGGGVYSAAPQVQQSISVVKAAQTITFTSTAPSPGAIGATYLVTATGGGSGNPVTFTIDGASTPGACSINASTVSFAAAGTCIVDANQAGNGAYSAAPQVQQSIAVALVPLAPTSIPTISDAMLLLLSAVLGIFGMAELRRRQR